MDLVFIFCAIVPFVCTSAVFIVLFAKPNPNNKKIQVQTTNYFVERYNQLIHKYNQTNEQFLINMQQMERKIAICHDTDTYEQLKKLVSNYERICSIANDYFKRASDCLNDNNYSAVSYCINQLDDTINEMDQIAVSINKITPKVSGYKFDTSNQNETKPVLQFFDGCNTKEEADARYKNLAKAFHPDNKGGNETLFRNMNEEYKSLRWQNE